MLPIPRRRDGHLFHLRCSRPVPGLRRSPFFGSGDARAGDKRDLSQVRSRVYRKDRRRNRARVGRREEAQRPPRGSRKLNRSRRTPMIESAGPELRIRSAAAQTRIVSVARPRLDLRKSVRPFKGIFCDDISEFESDHPSHAVGSQGTSAICGADATRHRRARALVPNPPVLICRRDVLTTVEQSEMSKWTVILLLVHRPFFEFN
jgi:hypothetical protein